MSDQIRTMDLIKELWKSGSSLDSIVGALKSAGKVLRNGNALSKTYVKSIIQLLIKKNELNKRPVVKDKNKV